MATKHHSSSVRKFVSSFLVEDVMTETVCSFKYSSVEMYWLFLTTFSSASPPHKHQTVLHKNKEEKENNVQESGDLYFYLN